MMYYQIDILLLNMLHQQGPEFIRANAKSSSILDIDDVECKTLHELFMNGVQISGKDLHCFLYCN